MSGPPAERSNEALCRSCGLCCDGTLFARVRLQQGESATTLRRRGLAILERDGHRSFEQPCAAYAHGDCHIYADRPNACRTYRCKLLRSYERGAVSWDEAIARVRRVRALQREIETELTHLAPAEHARSSAAIRSLLPTDAELSATPGLRRTWAPVLLRRAALLDILLSHFQARRAGKTAPE